MWYQCIAADAVAGEYASSGRYEHIGFESYLATVRKKQQNKLLSNKGLLCGEDQRLKDVCFVRSM